MAYDIFMLSGVVTKLSICKSRLSSFITAVATHMHTENPYHNFCHVVHVLHAVFLVSSSHSMILQACLSGQPVWPAAGACLCT